MKQIIMDIFNNTFDKEETIALINQITNQFPVGLILTYEDKFEANDKFYKLIDYSGNKFCTISEYLEHCPDDYIMYRSFPALMEHTNSFTRLYSIHPSKHVEYYIENNTFMVTDRCSRTYYITVLSDHSTLNKLTGQLEECTTKLHILEDLIPDYVFEYNMTTDTLLFPERWKPDGLNTEYPHATKWLELQDIIHPHDLPFILDAMTSNRLFKEIHEMEFRARFVDEEEYTWFRISYKIVRSRHTNHLRVVGCISNIDKEHLLSNEQQLEGIDKHTGLFIPAYMKSYIDQVLSDEPPETMCALMLLQLDNFDKLQKETGDLYSHHIERQVADKLKHSFRNTDILGYSRNGCYTIFLRQVPEHIITMRANHVLTIIRTMTFDNFIPPKLSCSIGISIAPLDGVSYMDLFLKADSAMYLSKARGGNTFSYYNTKVDARQQKTGITE